MGMRDKFFRALGLERGLVNITTANIIAAIVGGIFWLFLASILKVANYGELNYFISVAMISSVVSTLGLNVTVMTYLPKGEELLKNQANRMVLLSNCIILLPMIFIFHNISTLALVFGFSIFTMAQAELLGRRNSKKYFYITVGQRVLQVPLSLLLYYVIGIDGIILAYAISSLLFAYDFFKSLKALNFQFKELRSKFSFTKDVFFVNVSDRIGLYADKLLIAPLFGFEILGLYQFGFQFFLFLSILPVSLRFYILPQMAAGVHNKTIIRTSIIITSVISIISFFVIPELINSFFPLYRETIQASQIMVLAIIPWVISTVIGTRFFANGKSRIVLVGSIMRVLSLFILILFTGGTLGLFGLAMSVLISMSIQSIFFFIANYTSSK
ncbi:MAG: hypothetical protein AUH25_04235 [Thaumarchaeota archaeon 13_1_40CM_38_12]|nr:MAG: hypothetical protein AUH25_04235 [Thaumarchaeota archaeon 13_1_40CM_38_12]